MAKFLNTSATNFYLEELIRNASERLIIISPFLKFNDRIKELLSDKDRMKIDVRIIYGKSELAPKEINWLNTLEFVRLSFCQNLHAKCYLNEESAIITSMNLYDFSQVNNNEMGVFIERGEESELYRSAFEEAQRLIRISEQVRISAETIIDESENKPAKKDPEYEKLSTSRLAKLHKINTKELIQKLETRGLIVKDGDKNSLTEKGKSEGGELKYSQRFGQYFVWPKEMNLSD